MTYPWYLCVLVIIPQVTSFVSGKQCLVCDDVDEPSNCKTVTQCNSDESCFAETYFKVGRRRFRLGCRSREACLLVVSLSDQYLQRRSILCSRCCDTENCNRNVCLQQTPVDHVSAVKRIIFNSEAKAASSITTTSTAKFCDDFPQDCPFGCPSYDDKWCPICDYTLCEANPPVEVKQ